MGTHLLSSVTPDTRTALLNILDSTQRAYSNDEIQLILRQTQELFDLGPSLCGIAKVSPVDHEFTFRLVINLNYPEEWITQYLHNAYHHIDPILKRLCQQSCLCHWRDVYVDCAPWSEELKAFINKAQQYNLSDGFSASYHEQGQPTFAFLSYAYKLTTPPYVASALPTLSEAILPRLLRYAQEDSHAIKERIGQLTYKEIVILTWMRTGQTNAEIAKIIDFPERNVRFHIEQIFTKLGVTSRTQAVAFSAEYQLPMLYT
jgi:DNA-binding CsgD family transcriptional regulator